VHTARLFKRTESIVGQSTFKGFVLSPGGTIENPPPRLERRIEFVGDSITAGYGVEGDSPTCPFSVATENVGRSYAAMVAEAVGAEMMITAVSGLGVIRNYNDPEMIGRDAMTVRYGRALANEPVPLWNFQRWRADLVVINLGTNDFSTHPQPTEIVFVQAYIDLLNDIRHQYPFASIMAMAGPILPDYAAGYVETAVHHMNSAQSDHHIHFLHMPNNLVMPDDYGCDYHPNVSGQQKIAAVLIPKIQEVMGW
jgi:lysophospholipase L1-like esterase